MQKYTLSKILILISAALIISPVLFAGGQTEIVDRATLSGEVIYLEGDVKINNEAVDIGASVSPGDRIFTGIDSRAEISFGSRNILQFLENTSAEIEPAWSGVNLEGGTISAVLNGLARLGFSDDNRFQVRTATAAMGVRGTAFFIKSPEKNETYFCTCYGKLHLVSNDGTTEENTEAYHHAAVWYVRTPDGVRSFPSGLNYHDDAAITDIARKVGTTVRWRD